MAGIEKRTERFSESEIEDEVVLMRLDNGEFFSITGTGRAIWRLLDGCRDRTALLAALELEFRAPSGTIAGDVDRFLAGLSDAGLVAVA